MAERPLLATVSWHSPSQQYHPYHKEYSYVFTDCQCRPLLLRTNSYTLATVFQVSI